MSADSVPADRVPADPVPAAPVPTDPVTVDPLAAAARADAGPAVAAVVPARPPVLNVANYLTVLRLGLVPVLLVLLLADGGDAVGWRLAAFAAFAVASITDRIDGDIARSRGLVTDFGKVADPIADKALTGAAFVGLSALGDLAWGITVAVLVREIGVTLLRFWVIRHGVIPASRGGKVKTLLQSVALGLYLLPLPHWLHPLALAVMVVAIAVTYVTGADYVARALRLRRTSERALRRAR
jgi:CDP-diacylglycerol--glycerol-3-phosphate 3-phosphatidyltransferase